MCSRHGNESSSPGRCTFSMVSFVGSLHGRPQNLFYLCSRVTSSNSGWIHNKLHTLPTFKQCISQQQNWIEMTLSQHVVRAAKYKFIVPLYLLGAAYSHRDYVHQPTQPTTRGKVELKHDLHSVYIQYTQHYNIVRQSSQKPKAQVTRCTILAKNGFTGSNVDMYLPKLLWSIWFLRKWPSDGD